MTSRPPRRRAASRRLRVVFVRGGARVMEGDNLLTEIPSHARATHAFFDVVSACVSALSPGRRVALLGFAGGGMLAPLRAMGWPHPVSAVDLSTEGFAIFRRLVRPWAGGVRLHRGEASAWLARRRFDCIVEDLSIPGPEGVTKPPVSWNALPRLVRRSLGAGGLAVGNAIPVPGLSWRELLRRMSGGVREGLVLQFRDYENRILLTGGRLPDGRRAARAVRRALLGIGSRQAGRFTVRRIRLWPGGGGDECRDP